MRSLELFSKMKKKNLTQVVYFLEAYLYYSLQEGLLEFVTYLPNWVMERNLGRVLLYHHFSPRPIKGGLYSDSFFHGGLIIFIPASMSSSYLERCRIYMYHIMWCMSWLWCSWLSLELGGVVHGGLERKGQAVPVSYGLCASGVFFWRMFFCWRLNPCVFIISWDVLMLPFASLY